MAAAAETRVNSDFIGHAFSSRGALNVYKGAWYGTVIAISQAYGTAFYGAVTESRTTAKAISMDAVNKTAIRNIATFVPIIAGHTIAFTVLRDNFEQSSGFGSSVAWLKATAITALPTIGMAAYTRASPPAAVRFGLYSTVLLHLYDRVMKPKYPFGEHMEGTRRLF